MVIIDLFRKQLDGCKQIGLGFGGVGNQHISLGAGTIGGCACLLILGGEIFECFGSGGQNLSSLIRKQIYNSHVQMGITVFLIIIKLLPKP